MNSWCSRCALLSTAIVGCAICAELGGLAGVVHADFEHRDAVHGAQAQHHQRQADLVVQIARGRQYAVGAARGAQNRRSHFLDRRLAVAADDRDDRQREAPAPERGQAAQRLQRIVDCEQAFPRRRRRGEPRRVIGRDDGRGGAAFERLRDEFVPIEALALERDEELARTNDARIGADAVEPGVAPFEPRGYRLRRGRCIHHLPLHASSARAACSASLNGSRAPLHS